MSLFQFGKKRFNKREQKKVDELTEVMLNEAKKLKRYDSKEDPAVRELKDALRKARKF